jgi:hypothetical protein
MKTTTTDTPRTDECPYCGAFLLTHHTQAYCLERTARQKAEAELERLKALMHQTVWFVDDMIKTHTNGCEHCLKKHGAMIALFKDIAIEPQWPIDTTDTLIK